MKKNGLDYLIVVIGLLLLGFGLFLVKTLSAPVGIMRAIPYISIGIGCGAFGHGIGKIISQKAIRTSLKIQMQLEIDKNDERNVAILNRAKAKVYDMMIFVFGVLMLVFALMGIDLIAVLLLVFSYLFVMSSGIYYRWKYEREM